MNQSRKSNLSVCYFTLNEVDLLLSVISPMAELGCIPQIFLDSCTNPSELAKVRNSGFDYQVLVNPKPGIPEAMHEQVARSIQTEWVWILNTDELLTQEGVACVTQATQDAPEDIVCMGFPRVWLYMDKDQNVLRSRARFIGEDTQWRIFRPDRVSYTSDVHTPGFELPDNGKMALGREATVYHVDWLVHSEQMRRQKLRYYELHAPGSARRFRKWYLPENRRWVHRMRDEPNEWVSSVARGIAGRGHSKSWVANDGPY